MTPFKPEITPLTDSALLIKFGDEINVPINNRVHALAFRLRAQPLIGFQEAVPAYATLAVHYDSLLLTFSQVKEWLTEQLNSLNETSQPAGRLLQIPVIYDGPDLPFVAQHCGLTIAEVIKLHTSTDYTVYMMGFSPGFPYLGLLPAALQTPRLASPRTHVPAGSVAIAGLQTGIYPMASPGGWQLIGRTELSLFNPLQESPFLFSPSDTVRFLQDA